MATLGFNMGAGDQNSGLHVCAASTLPMAPSPYPSSCFWLLLVKILGDRRVSSPQTLPTLLTILQLSALAFLPDPPGGQATVSVPYPSSPTSVRSVLCRLLCSGSQRPWRQLHLKLGKIKIRIVFLKGNECSEEWKENPP